MPEHELLESAEPTLAPPAAASPDAASPDAAFAVVALRRAVDDVATLVRCDFALEAVETEHIETRAAGARQVHVAFRVEVRADRRTAHGALLVPLPEALELASRLLSAPEERLAERRAAERPEPAEKNALLELGSFVGGALDQAASDTLGAGWSVRFAGCQGVRAGVRPAFPHAEGAPLTLVRARARLAGGAPFELLAMLPALGAGA